MNHPAALLGLVVALAAAGCGSADGPAPTKATASPTGASPTSPMASAPTAAPSAPTSSGDGSSGVPAVPAAQPCTGKLVQPLDDTWSLDVGGTTRALNVHVPASYDPSNPTPVVLNFHGFTSDAAQQDLLSGMSAKADAEGFIAVHPEGLGVPQSWNAGACCGYATQNDVDDIGFVNATLDQLEAQLCVDTHRVFATGMSNGGFFSHRLGCELSSRIAAIAPVAGVLGEPTCTPGRPVPVMEFHGTLDPLVPYGGSTVLGFPPVPTTFEGWATRDGCTGAPADTLDDVDSHCSTYGTCSSGSVVTLCTVDGGGHTWPGGLPVPVLGYTTPFLSATDAMWTFFQAHPLP